MVLSKLDGRVYMGMYADDVGEFVGAENLERGLANDLTVNSVDKIREIRENI